MIHFINVGNGDAILIKSQDKNGCKHILIDGGKERNAIINNRFKHELLEIIGKNGYIDLLIVTHSDDDHIGGILNLVGDPSIEARICKYVFNAEKYISSFLERKYNSFEEYKVKEATSGTVKSSYRQDKELTEFLDNVKGKWDTKVYTANDSIRLDDLSLTLLSPNTDKLNRLQSYWEKEKRKYKEKQAKKSSTKKSSVVEEKYDYSTSFKDFKYEDQLFGEDDSETNGASIAFIYESSNIKALMLADAHPSVIVDSLRSQLKEGETVHKFDVVKLSHHGSKNNITLELLNLIECEHFVISADASKTHRHPNKSTLALILDHYGKENVNFYFTVDNSKLREIFIGESFKKIHFPKKGSNKITIPYGN